MKIKRLKMTAFGHHQSKVIEISDDFNLILQGKKGASQTVRDFIQVMLFGMDEEMYRLYKPQWGGFEGEIDLELDGKGLVRVTRNFLNQTVQIQNEAGDEITDDFIGENGEVKLLPYSDQIYGEAGDVRKPSEEISDLQKQLDAMMESHELIDLYQQKQLLENQLENTQETEKSEKPKEETLIESLEKKLEQVREKVQLNTKAAEKEIAQLKARNEAIDENLKALEEKRENSQDQSSRSKLLERNEIGANERISQLTKQLDSLYEEQDVFKKRIDLYRSRFYLNKNELIDDYEKVQYALDSKAKEEIRLSPKIVSLASMPIFVFILMALAGCALIALGVMNPGAAMGRPMIFICCFIGCMLLGCGIYFWYLHAKVGGEETPSTSEYQPIDAVEAVLQKYRKKTIDQFDDFYQKSMKVFAQMDDLEQDLEDIQNEIDQTRSELEHYTKDRNAYREDLEDELRNVQQDQSEESEEIRALEDEKDQNLARIEAIESSESFHNPIVITTKDQQEMRFTEFEEYIHNRIAKLQLKLERKQEKYHPEQTEEKYAAVCNEIDKIEMQMDEIRDEITALKAIENQQEPTKEELLESFGVGLLNHLKNGYPVPLILVDQFESYPVEKRAKMIHQFRELTKNEQVLVFTTGNQLKKIFDAMQWPYSGILI